jgi:phosphotriesterase-related protein
MAAHVNTVTGSVPADRLGKTLIHEHILFGFPGYQGDRTLGPFDHEAALRSCLEAAERVKTYGVQTVVNATPNECGRSPKFLREVAEQSGLNIICPTGYYFESTGGSAYFKFRSSLGDIEQEIIDLFLTEVTVGVEQTDIKAGIFKLASSKERITDYEKRFFRAAAKVHQATGVPILTHTTEGTMAPEQARLLISQGANPKKILISHMGSNLDIDYHLETLAEGVSIAFDQWGIEELDNIPPENVRIELLLNLLAKGYVDQIMLSNDSVWHWLGRPLNPDEYHRKLLANWHTTYLFEGILPLLEHRGVSKEEVETILVRNPFRFFS